MFIPSVAARLNKASLESVLVKRLGAGGYEILGLIFFAAMAGILWRVALRPSDVDGDDNLPGERRV